MTIKRGIATKAQYRASDVSELPAIHHVEAQCYAQADSALSQALIETPVDTFSFIAELDGQIIGHILLTRIDGPQHALALAPLAILPEWRDMQIGTELVRYALSQLRKQGWQSVFVYGQPDYYGRFGFKSELADPAQTPWQGPMFLALELTKGALSDWKGPLHFPPAYENLAKAILR